MFGIGGGEILLIALVAVVLFGTDYLPKNLRKFMKVWSDFRGATHDLQRGWLDVRDKVTRDILSEESQAHAPEQGAIPEATDDTLEAGTDPTSPKAEGLAENTILAPHPRPEIRKAEGAYSQDDSLASPDETQPDLTNSTDEDPHSSAPNSFPDKST